jgi:hypothetical protein
MTAPGWPCSAAQPDPPGAAGGAVKRKIIRSRSRFLALAAATVALGLATRAFRGVLPAAIGAYAGDVLWAAMVYLLIAAVWRQASIGRVAAGAAMFSLAIELSQLYHASWIDAVRRTRLGGLVLGFGFLWSDLACYAAGIALAAALDIALTRPTRAGADRGSA